MKYIIIGCVIVFCFFQYRNVTVERNFINSCAQTDPVTLKKYCKCVFDEIVDTQGIQAIKDADKQSAAATVNQFQPEINYCIERVRY